MSARTANRVLVALTLAGGAFELVSTPFMEQPLASLLAGLAFLAVCAWLVRSRGIVAPALLGLLFAVELSGEPFYARHGLHDWIVQGVVGVASLVGFAAAVVVARDRVRSRRAVAA